MTQQEENDIEKIVEERLKKLLPQYLKSTAFTLRKVTDMPFDDLMTTSRKYVNLNGSIASAPQSSIIGQQYFASDLGYPVFKHQNSRWVNSQGSIVG